MADASRSLPLGPFVFYAPPLGVDDVVATFSGSLPLGAMVELPGSFVGNTLTANVGSYAYTGATATLKVGYRLYGSEGTYAYDGIDADLSIASPTNVFGPPAPLPVFADLFTDSTGIYRLQCYTGNYAYTGQSATMSTGFVLTCQSGSYAYTGADGQRDLAMSGGTGAYAYAGPSQSLNVGKAITASAGAYEYTGSPAGLFYENVTGNYTLACLPGWYFCVGYAATLTKTYRLQAEAGDYAYTGRSVTLRKVGLYGDPWDRVPTDNGIWTPVNAGDATWETIE